MCKFYVIKEVQFLSLKVDYSVKFLITVFMKSTRMKFSLMFLLFSCFLLVPLNITIVEFIPNHGLLLK